MQAEKGGGRGKEKQHHQFMLSMEEGERGVGHIVESYTRHIGE